MGDYEPYKYEPPPGKLVKVQRGVLYNRYTYKQEHGTRTRWEVAKHPNWLSKTLAVVLFPLSVVITGAPDAWRDTVRHLWDRRYGSFTSAEWWADK